MIAPRFVDITVERTTKYITVEEIDKRTGEVQTRRLRFTGVTITIKAPGVELSFTSTRTRSGWGMWRDARTVETARRASHDTWDDLARTLLRFTDAFGAAAALTRAKQLMVAD